jgi:hypothetical protein
MARSWDNVQDLGIHVQDLGHNVHDLGFIVQDLVSTGQALGIK